MADAFKCIFQTDFSALNEFANYVKFNNITASLANVRRNRGEKRQNIHAVRLHIHNQCNTIKTKQIDRIWCIYTFSVQFAYNALTHSLGVHCPLSRDLILKYTHLAAVIICYLPLLQSSNTFNSTPNFVRLQLALR